MGSSFYVWSGNEVIAEYSISDQLMNQYIYANGRRVAQLKVAEGGGKETYYVHSDRLGSQRLQTRSNGMMDNKVCYDIWGQQRWVSGASRNSYRFIGGQWDNSYGESYYYLRNRYYNPTIGRFTTPDPIVSGLSPYAYCRNNPVMFSDPSGLFPPDDFSTSHYDWGWANGHWGNSNSTAPNPPYRQMTEQSLPSPFYDGSGLPAGGDIDRGLSYPNSDFDLSRIHYNGPTLTSNTTYGAGDKVDMYKTMDPEAAMAQKMAAAAAAVLKNAQGRIGDPQPANRCNYWVQAVFAAAGFPLSGNKVAADFGDYAELEITDSPAPGDIVQLLNRNGRGYHVAIYSGDGNMITPIDHRLMIRQIPIGVFIMGRRGSTVYLHYVGIKERT